MFGHDWCVWRVASDQARLVASLNAARTAWSLVRISGDDFDPHPMVDLPRKTSALRLVTSLAALQTRRTRPKHSKTCSVVIGYASLALSSTLLPGNIGFALGNGSLGF